MTAIAMSLNAVPLFLKVGSQHSAKSELIAVPPQTISPGTHPASYPLGTEDSFPGAPGLKQPGREAHRSPPCGAEDKNA